jgi:spore maturation protein CgeB
MKILFIGLSITSAWGNGHATTYRALLRELSRRGHDILFLERDQPWYAENRDLPLPIYCRTELYRDLADLKRRFAGEVRDADCVIVGSYVPEGIAVGAWITRLARGRSVFYDIDTPITLAQLSRNECEYLTSDLIPRYDLYLSFTGGPMLQRLEFEFRSPRAAVLYCSVDPSLYYPSECAPSLAIGYLGTYSADRQPGLERLLIEPARRMPAASFLVAGAQYPPGIQWPANVRHVSHLDPSRHRAFYNSQRFTLNLTRREMIAAGYSPSVRLFEAAACGTPVISDAWPGLETLFELGSEILVADSSEAVREYLRDLPESERVSIGARARQRVLEQHTAAHRAAELETLITGIRRRELVATAPGEHPMEVIS